MSDDKDKSRSSSVDEYVTPSTSTTASHTPDIIQPREGPDIKEGVLNQDQLTEKLKQIPIGTLKEILTNQIDLEIRLKHKELKLTEEEIGKCESQMITLRKFFEIPNNVNFDNEPNDFTIKYYDLLNKSLSVNYTNLQKQQYLASDHHELSPHDVAGQDYVYEPVHSYRTRSTTSSLRPSIATSVSSTVPPPPPNYTRTVGCLHRRTDGVIVKLTCPDCHRSNFSSAQGFLNHSRIAHAKEYTSQDAAALKCGEILPDYEQDEEGLLSIKNLKAKNIDPNKNLNVNEIYFNGLSNSLNTVHRSTVSSTGSATPPSTNLSKLPEAVETKPAKSELMKKLIKNGITSDEQQYQEMIKEVKDEVKLLHLFDDEEEVDENEEAIEVTTSAVKPSPSKLNRRKSRGVMGISSGPPEEVGSKGPEEEHAGGPTNGTRSKSGGVQDVKRRKR